MKQNSAGWADSPVYDCSREEAVFIILGRGGDLLIFGFIAGLKVRPLQRGAS